MLHERNRLFAPASQKRRFKASLRVSSLTNLDKPIRLGLGEFEYLELNALVIMETSQRLPSCPAAKPGKPASKTAPKRALAA